MARLLACLVRRSLSPRAQGALRRRYLAWQVAIGRTCEERELTLLSRLVQPGDFVIDLGANVGQYTQLFSERVGTRGRFFAFEPILENYEVLELVARKTPLPNVELFRAAVGSTDGRTDMLVPEASGFDGFYLAHVAETNNLGPRRNVPMVSLDSLFKEGTLRRVDLVKCDVEGAELSVLRGARLLNSAS